jgi:hypothetical protein
MEHELTVQWLAGKRDIQLATVVAIATMVNWLPLIIEPTLDISPWVTLTAVLVCPGLATILSGGKFLPFPPVASVATFVGLLGGCLIWPQEDGIAQSYMGIAAVVAAVVVCVVSLGIGLLSGLIRVSNVWGRCLVWFAFLCVVASGPIELAIRPPIVAHRLARNEQLARQRVSSLKNAFDQVEAKHPGSGCDVSALKQYYSGPSFTEQDWGNIIGNAITEDGYAVSIEIDCSQPRFYEVFATPKRGKSDGSRFFCADATGMRDCSRR